MLMEGQRWSYEAKNSTFRAIRAAGFNENNFPLLRNYMLVTEPEAAAVYTAHYMRQEEAETLKAGLQKFNAGVSNDTYSVENASFCAMLEAEQS